MFTHYLSGLVRAGVAGAAISAGLCLWFADAMGFASSGADTLYVVNRANSAESVLKFDATTGAPTGAFASPGGGIPYGLTCARNGNLLITRQATNEVVEFNNATGTLTRVFANTNLTNPTGIAIGPNGNVFVANVDAGTVVEFDGTTGAFAQTFASALPGGPFSIAFGSNGNLFVALGFGGGGVWELHGTTGAFVRNFPVPFGDPRGLTIGPNGRLYVALFDVNRVAEFDLATGTFLRMIGVGLCSPHGLTFGPNGNLFVTSHGCNRVDEVDIGTGGVIGTFATAGLVLPLELLFGTTSGPCGPLAVKIDIKPGSDPNSINLGSAGSIPVAVLSQPEFSAHALVDPESLRLAGAAVNLIGRSGRLQCSAGDVNADGLSDLVCHFQTAQFMIEPGDTIAVLEGKTFDGRAIRGQDSIRIVH